MPQRRCAIKALRKNEIRHLHNLDFKTALRKLIKNFLVSIRNKNKEEAQTSIKGVSRKLDKAIKRNILQKNTVARRKARFAKLLNSLT